MKKIFFILFMVLSSIIYGQSFNRHDNLNVRILNDTILRPFDSNPVTSIGISGHVSFTSELGFVRFVVNDNNDNEYMIYESYCLFEDTISFNFSQKCEESCFYESYTPTEISVQVKDAIIIVNSVDLSNAQYSNAESLRKTAAATSNNQKLIKVKDYIQSKGLIWVASQTRLSSLSYQQKSDLFGKDYKTYGYEFYSKGFFSIFGPERYSSSKNFVHNFDWRNRHGANDSLSLYYDGDTLGTGWITPIVCQGNGCWINGCFDCYMDSVQCNQLGGEYRAVPTCWIFGPTAQVEALTNLYYNQHIDVDLSEQYIACKENTISQNYPHVALRHYKREGVPLESCLPYSASLNNCDDLCSDSLVRVSIDTCISHSHFNTTDSLLKQYLINKGPLTAASLPLGFGMNKHCMALIGWGTIDDDIAKEVLGVPIDENGNYDTGFLGLTYWIYKQSNGIDVGDNGFMYILHINDDVPDITYSIPTPIHYNNMTESDVRCNDYDGDGYYNWGIGPKPAHCPSCPDEPDGDDSNPNLGPLNSYGQCTIIGTYNASFEDGWDNWMQVETLFEDNGIFWRHSNPPSSTLTGPSNAQDGDYYIYINSRAMVNYNHSTSCIESPDINIQDSCYNYLDFYYHMKIYDWHSGEENPYIMLSTQKANNTWSSSYPKWIEYGDHGSDWQHATILLPTDVKKVRLYVETGTYQYSDIAIDNITIGPWTYNDSAIVINDSITWTENKIINTDIIVDNGGCLTIKKATGNKLNIKLHPNSKIIVKPGGKLIIDRSRLTCACPGQMWRGIEVWGDSSQDQQPHHGDYHQGYLEMKNGATIENAVCAVELWHPGYY
ncbi:MAG: hypothetical protein IJT45_08205, partial [Bacteroidales bacterium]|nr:hypothetical protein [Bacteroidales bacterium]